jgi:ATP-binding cassette subfamily C protein
MRELVNTVRQALALLNAPFRRRWILQVPWALLSAALEMIATAGMLILIRLISDPAAADRMASVKLLRAWLGVGSGPEFSALFGLLLALLYLLKNVLRVTETYSQQRCAADTAAWISSGLLRRYLQAPYRLHIRRNSSDMLNNVNAADQVSWIVLQSATALISEALIALGILVVLIQQLPPLERTAAALTGAVTILLLWITQQRHIRWGRVTHEMGARKLQSLRQSLAAIKEVKILGREEYFVARFARLRTALGDVEARQITTEVVPRLVVETTFVAALAALIVIVWLRPQPGGDLMLALGVFAYGGLRLLPSLHLVVYRFNRIGSGATAVESVARDWMELAPDSEKESSREARLLPFQESVEFDLVSFTYDGDADGVVEPALHDVNLVIRRGDSIGIVGPTGSGKTTLVDLLLGILSPTSGAVRVDGTDLRAALRDWQRQIGYVPQTVYLIDDTIRRNIALALDDAAIDEERVLEAAHAAQLDEFIRGLSDGLNTVVGERGVKLSGGERQRIAVARALYRRPAVLVFDEATSALDYTTEQALTASLQRLPGGVTKVFIAHRLSTVQACDRLVFLRKGRIAGLGPYSELLRNPEFLAFTLAGDSENRPAMPESVP